MGRSITIRRWTAELHQRAVYLTRVPDPNCPNCSGSQGGWVPHGMDAYWDECACLDQLRTWTLPLWPRRAHRYEESPF